MIRICFVCLGNICRSPTAEAVMRALVESSGLSDRIEIDSAGTGDWHVGHPPDSRSTAAARKRGIKLEGQARQWTTGDWDRFDYVLAMDESNLRNLEATISKPAHRAKLSLLRAFDAASPPNAAVPDPYYTKDGFDEVIDLCETACAGLFEHIRRRHVAELE